MKHPFFAGRSFSTQMLTRSLAAMALLASTIVFAADVASVRVVVGGQAYVGQLAPETPPAPPPVTQPATQPDAKPSTKPTTKPAETTAETITGPAPFQVHLDAADVIQPNAIRDAVVTWDFGDANGRFNKLDGFNAGHIYDAVGTYTIVRTAKTPAGDSVKRWTIDVKPSTRRVTYVSLDGDDRNDGKTPATAVHTWDRGVLGTNGGNGDVLFRRGDQFSVTRSLNLKYDDCRIGAFGDPGKPKPVLFNLGEIGSSTMIYSSGKRFVVEDLTFDAPKAKAFDKRGTLDIVTAGGAGVTVRRCTVLNVNDLVNGNAKPAGVLVQDCEAPSETGLRSYFCWVEGSNWTIVGNRVANSTREHVVRVGGADRINAQFNHFTNLNRTTAATQPDSLDVAKAAFNVQKGSVLYVANNVLVGPSGVGPLGKQDGLTEKGAKFTGAIIEHNRITGPIEVKHGAVHVTYRDNLIRMDNSVAFPLDGWSKDYDRTINDVRIERNTVINTGKGGNFLTVWAGAKSLAVVGNAFIAPQLSIGAGESSAIYVLEPDLRAFTTISGNVWPVAKPTGFAHNGIHYASWKAGEGAGYIEPAAWMKMPQVAGDRFEKIEVDGWANVKGAGVDASRLPQP